MCRGDEVHPVLATPTGHSVPAVGDAFTMEPEAPLQTAQVDATAGVEVDLHVRHVHYSQSRLCTHRNAEIYPTARSKFILGSLLHRPCGERKIRVSDQVSSHSPLTTSHFRTDGSRFNPMHSCIESRQYGSGK